MEVQSGTCAVTGERRELTAKVEGTASQAKERHIQTAPRLEGAAQRASGMEEKSAAPLE